MRFKTYVPPCGGAGAVRSRRPLARGGSAPGEGNNFNKYPTSPFNVPFQQGDIRHFGDADLHRWRGGHWAHTRHGGRLGWWWVVGGVWYFYPAPIYPYPDPYVPPVVVTPEPPAAQAPPQYWYYCPSRKSYYPYVTSCPEGWMQVVPQVPPQ